ncbi:MAG: helix-turn-helix domain-containing protein [Prevotellaceae bacterium]|nr:helix-turn-helix domain-containing protein [Prevotellaceae bacterium]
MSTLSNLVFYVTTGNRIMNTFCVMLLCIYLIFSIVLYFIPITKETVIAIVSLYAAFELLIQTIIAMVNWHSGSVANFGLLLLLPWSVMVFCRTNRRTGILWTRIVLCTMVAVFISAPVLPDFLMFKMSSAEMHGNAIITAIWSVIFLMFFVSTEYKFECMLANFEKKTNDTKKDNRVENTGGKPTPLSTEKMEKYHREILQIFEIQKPFANPAFQVYDLARMLKTNVTYIKQTLKHYYPQSSFTDFVNMYRIKLVKELITSHATEKYTIEFIYSSAGFNHQATFNRIFKHFEGVTPTEYIGMVKSALV